MLVTVAAVGTVVAVGTVAAVVGSDEHFVIERASAGERSYLKNSLAEFVVAVLVAKRHLDAMS